MALRQVKEDGISLAEVKKGISLSMPKMPHAEDAATGAYAKLDPPFFHTQVPSCPVQSTALRQT